MKSDTEAPRVMSTARLYGIRLSSLDFPDMWELNDDPEVAASISPTGTPLPEPDQQRVLENHIAHWEQHGFGLYVLHRVKDGAVIGYCGLMSRTIDDQPETDIAYALKPDYWGHGYGTEAVRKVVDVAFKTLHLPSLGCMVQMANKSSRHVIDKCGFHFEKHVDHAGLPHLFYRLNARA